MLLLEAQARHQLLVPNNTPEHFTPYLSQTISVIFHLSTRWKALNHLPSQPPMVIQGTTAFAYLTFTVELC